MQQLHTHKVTPPVSYPESMAMLSKASHCDLIEISKVHNNLRQASDQLSHFEKKYKIKNFRESRKLRNYPRHVRAKVANLWHLFYKGSRDLDFLFIDEDYYC